MPRLLARRLLHTPRYLNTQVQRGQTVRQIADTLGMHRTTVREQMRRYGIQPTKQP